MFAIYSNRSCLQLKLWVDKAKGVLELANALPGINRGIKQKGQQTYDWTNKVMITIDSSEAFYIMQSIRNKQKYSIVHTLDNKSSTLFLDYNKDYINVTVINDKPSQKTQVSFGMKLTSAELNHFLTWCRYVKDLPFIIDVYREVLCAKE